MFSELEKKQSDMGVQSHSISRFDPYLHGTTSIVLVSLLNEKTRALMPPLDMIEQHGQVSFGGEINKGGLDDVCSTSNPAFGKLLSDGFSDYTLEKIIKNYTYIPIDKYSAVTDRKRCIELIKQELKKSKECSFSNINLLLIYIARAKQMGIDNSEFISEDHILDLYADLDALLQFYYLLLFLGRYLFPKTLTPAFLHENRTHLKQFISSNLTFDKILTRIKERHLDLEDIYFALNNITDADQYHEILLNVVQLLSLPPNSAIEYPGQDDTAQINFFSSVKQPYGAEASYWTPEHLMGYMACNIRNNQINDFLFRFLDMSKMPKELFTIWHESIHEYIPAIRRRRKLLQQVLEQKSFNLLNEKNRTFLDNPFPLIFICEPVDPSSIKLFDKYQKEYRAESPMELGKDITMIATIPEYVQALSNELKNSRIDNVSIITIEQLKQSKMTHERPAPQTDTEHEILLTKLINIKNRWGDLTLKLKIKKDQSKHYTEVYTIVDNFYQDLSTSLDNNQTTTALVNLVILIGEKFNDSDGELYKYIHQHRSSIQKTPILRELYMLIKGLCGVIVTCTVVPIVGLVKWMLEDQTPIFERGIYNTFFSPKTHTGQDFDVIKQSYNDSFNSCAIQ